jgi:hypothetical protein
MNVRMNAPSFLRYHAGAPPNRPGGRDPVISATGMQTTGCSFCQ